MSPKRRAQMVSSETASIIDSGFKALPQDQHLPSAIVFADEQANLQPLEPRHPSQHRRMRTAIIEGDIIDVAIDWQSYKAWSESSSPAYDPADARSPSPPIPTSPHQWRGSPLTPSTINEPNARVLLLNAADDRSPGGEWIEGTLGPEEELARRSNFVKTLDYAKPRGSQFTIPRFGGIYSPDVIIFREGPEHDYARWTDEKCHRLSVLSVTPARRPKVQCESPTTQQTKYAFDQERDEQRKKMQVALRIAARKNHINLCLNGFGSSNSGGPESTFGGAGKFRNPLSEVISLWKELLLDRDSEFAGYFQNIVIAVQPGTKDMWLKEF